MGVQFLVKETEMLEKAKGVGLPNFLFRLQYALYEDAYEGSELQDYMIRDFVRQDMYFDGEFSTAGTLETALCL
jgi:hypothetical protein